MMLMSFVNDLCDLSFAPMLHGASVGMGHSCDENLRSCSCLCAHAKFDPLSTTVNMGASNIDIQPHRYALKAVEAE